MEMVVAIVAGVLVAGGIYLLLSRALIRLVLGVVLLGNGVNLFILTAGRLTHATPPIVPSGQSQTAASAANPLPQALILTAIVIGFSLFAYLAVLTFRAYQSLDADDSDHLRLAEPPGEPRPPLEY
jgi:multicomponent Na+:H+ antiporter subunit C